MRHRREFSRWLASALICLLIVGCAGGGFAPVRQVGASKSTHTVVTGDTLYSIAFRYGLDFQSVARANNIRKPYTIFVGQRLKIPSTKTVAPEKDGPPPGKRVSKPSLETVVVTAKPPAKKTPTVTRPSGASTINWAWPLAGEVLRRFALQGEVNKGIDIGASAGTAVKAAADGVVVYAGGNLRGYGKLVIVKHNDAFLSAYGNNRSIRVKEGAKVKQGQKISVVGTNRAQQALLHFEIRRDGKPVNPELHLPAVESQ